jgi:hypothetical protein
MSVAVWWWVRAALLVGAAVFLLLHMEWSEDRQSPSAFPAAPIQIAAASPIVVPAAASDCIETSVELSPTGHHSVVSRTGIAFE